MGIWFIAIKTKTGTDVFTERLVKELNKRSIKASVTWLPQHAEYAPWIVSIPKAPAWATVVHINTWLHQRFIPPNLPVLATLHHAVHHQDTKNYKNWIQKAYHRYWIKYLERRALQRADKVVSVSKFVSESAKTELLDLPMEVIYNGVDTNKFIPAMKEPKKNEPFRLLFIGTWSRRKGVDLLPKIMDKLGGEFELLYTGKRKLHQGDHRTTPNMINIGRLEGEHKVIEAMQKCDALLFPSRSEGFGLVAIEAMSCGLPVIASDGTPLTEIVIDEVNGEICKKNNVDSFVKAAIKTRNLKLDKQEVRKTVEYRFSMNNFISSYIEKYKELSNK